MIKNKGKNNEKKTDKSENNSKKNNTNVGIRDAGTKDDKMTESLDSLKLKIKYLQEIIKEYDVPLDNISSKAILEKIMEALEYYVKILLQLLQPEDFASLHECAIFNEPDKAKMFATYTDMMILDREILKSLIKNEEPDIIITISYAHSELKILKVEMIQIVQKMQDSWKEKGTSSRMKYFG